MSTSDATPPGDEGGTRLSIGAVIAIAVAVLAIAGVGGYLIGHDRGEKSGDTKGYDEGLAAGRAQVEADYRRGAAGYRAIFVAGRRQGFAEGRAQGEKAGEAQGEKQGERVGFEQGERQGVTTGQAEGVRQGAAAVLGGFDSWTTGAFYVVTMAAGAESGVPYVISSRTQLQPGTDYSLCGGGGRPQLCQTAAAGAASGGNADNGGAQE